MSGARIVMAGTALHTPGGMTSVVQSYRDSGLFQRWNVLYLESYHGPGPVRQITTMLGVVGRLLSLLVRRKVRLVHVHSASRGSFMRKSVLCWLSWLFGVPFVFHLHSGEFPVFYSDECGPLRKRWVRWVLRNASVVAVLTPSWAQTLAAIEPAAKVKVLLNPIEVSPEPPALREAAQRVLFLGRLREKKGVFDLVRALPAVLAEFPSVKVCLAGDGELETVQRLAAELGVAHAVETPGWVDGAVKDGLLREADVLVLPSYFEGLPVCVLEAMAAGVPVVATQVGGIPFALDEGQCGLLVPPGDPQALAAALLKVIGDVGLRHTLVQQAHERARSIFSVASVNDELERLWNQALPSKETGMRNSGALQ